MQRCAGEICYTNVWCAPHCKNALSFLEAKIKELLFTVYKTVKRSSFLFHRKLRPVKRKASGRAHIVRWTMVLRRPKLRSSQRTKCILRVYQDAMQQNRGNTLRVYQDAVQQNRGNTLRVYQDAMQQNRGNCYPSLLARVTKVVLSKQWSAGSARHTFVI